MQIYELLDLKIWDGLASDQREAVAREVGRRLPSSFQYAGLQTHTMGDQTHEIAFFDYARCRFALIPGGVATLGYDRAHPFIPTEEMLADWNYFYEAYDNAFYYHSGLTKAEVENPSAHLPRLEQHLDTIMTPLRKVVLKPLLVETVPFEFGVSSVPVEEVMTPEVLEQLHLLDPSFNIISVQRKDVSTHSQIVAALAKEGFRLPSSDEWEYLCAAGAVTLWRWGNTCPLDEYPTRVDPNDPRCHPNAFGLTIANHHYKWEVCGTPGLMRGGDGGTTACGGEGVFRAQLTLASAYTTNWDVDKPIYGGHVRRVLDLPEE